MTALAADTHLLFSWNKNDRFAAFGTKRGERARLLRALRSAVGAELSGRKYILSAGRALPEWQIVGAMRVVFLILFFFFLAQKPTIGKGTDNRPAQDGEKKAHPVDLLFPAAVEQDAQIGKIGEYDRSHQREKDRPNLA